MKRGDKVRLVVHPNLGEHSGQTGVVTKVNPKTVDVFLDSDEEALTNDSAPLLWQREVDAYVAKHSEPMPGANGAKVFGVPFFNVRERWAIRVTRAAIEKEVV